MGSAAHPNAVFSAKAIGYGAVWIVFSISGIVFFEPAPFDIALLGLTVVFFLSGMRIPGWMTVPIVLLIVTFLMSLIGAFQTPELSDNIKHATVTLYLAISTIFIGCYVYSDPGPATRVIFRGYAVAAVIAAISGLIGYFSLTSGAYELFTENARARGTFKDPNVFGPFLIVPALFAFYRLIEGAGHRAPYWLMVFLLLSAGIFLSFSRGAWGHYLLSFITCLVLLYFTSDNKRLRYRISLATLTVVIMSALGLLVILSLGSVSQLLTERLQLFQNYDLSSGDGRFSGQIFALNLILQHPFGVGAQGFVRLWGLAPHNVYLHNFIIAGWFGGFAYLLLVLTTCICGFVTALRPSPYQGIAIVLFASFFGLAILGLLIDTDHWRHFYILTGLIWGLSGAVLKFPLTKFNS